MRSIREFNQLNDFAILKFEEVQDFRAEDFPAWTVSDDKAGPYCSTIPFNQFAQDLALFEVEMVNELTEGATQWFVPLHTSCQVQCAFVAHQIEQALGMKSGHQGLPRHYHRARRKRA
ncbi:hypothetical protein AB7M69_003315 [Bradyrhizobium japonicum]